MTNPQHSNSKCEHYTPHTIVKLARELMVFIDLDPASDEMANRVVKANKFFNAEIDGYNQPWLAQTVFCNPPGRTKDSPRSQPGITEWFLKMYSEYKKDNFVEGIFIGYSLELLSKCGDVALQFPICIPQPHRLGVTTGMGRIKFDAIADGERVSQKQPTHGNVIIYFPPKYRDVNENAVYYFKNMFSQLGACK